MNEKLTVVVPVYNVENYLRKCIDSILAQTISVSEIILVDDGSTDQSGNIADEYASKYSRIRTIHQPNGGLAVARNTGINAATGEYITFVDSDDYIESAMYEELLDNLIKTQADMSIGGVWYEEENGTKYSPYPLGITRVWNKEDSLIELNSFKYFNMSFCDAIFKRDLFEGSGYGEGALRFPKGKLCEDFYLMHRIVARTEKIAYTSKPYYHYVQRRNSISRNKKVNIAPIDASLKQLDFYRRWFPKLSYIAETAVFFAHAGIYTSYCRIGQPCPTELMRKINPICHRYLMSVMKNCYIPKVKKAQALMFCFAKPVYKVVVRRKEHR